MLSETQMFFYLFLYSSTYSACLSTACRTVPLHQHQKTVSQVLILRRETWCQFHLTVHTLNSDLKEQIGFKPHLMQSERKGVNISVTVSHSMIKGVFSPHAHERLLPLHSCCFHCVPSGPSDFIYFNPQTPPFKLFYPLLQSRHQTPAMK